MSYKNVVKVVKELQRDIKFWMKKVDKMVIELDKSVKDLEEIKNKVLNNNKNNKPVSDPPTKGTWDEAYKIEKPYPKVKKVINRDW